MLADVRNLYTKQGSHRLLAGPYVFILENDIHLDVFGGSIVYQ